MPQTEKLNALGIPVINLPEDIGDGPFLSPSGNGKAEGPKMAESEELFRRTEPFKDNFLTDMPVLGRSSHIMIGRFHVSDTLKPQSFRRVYQTFSYQESADLKGTFEIRFTGAGIAIFRESMDALAGNVGPKAKGAFADAMDTLEAGKLVAQPTLPSQATTYEIRLRMPGYEPDGSGRTLPVDPRCVLATSEEGQRLLKQNSIETFSFGNHANERRVFPITYPVGRSIPVIFDIINRSSGFSINVDLIVEVLIDRSKQNAEFYKSNKSLQAK
ncbi:hypothetical protein [Rhizobium paknamense]|uniref:Uncharacterized protein n=1 Tax=Rhizobium paknamense TaxID=1206817 RepID=A0ABU0IIT0_9HYPH|nr:hypothetical protein [Rhizobium paknamense]MDQ0458081.1 hypothetical protein [Rhizobium paknamense]